MKSTKSTNVKPFRLINLTSNSIFTQPYSSTSTLQAQNFLSTYSCNFHWQIEEQRRRTSIQRTKLGSKRKTKAKEKPKKSQEMVTLADRGVRYSRNGPKKNCSKRIGQLNVSVKKKRGINLVEDETPPKILRPLSRADLSLRHLDLSCDTVNCYPPCKIHFFTCIRVLLASRHVALFDVGSEMLTICWVPRGFWKINHIKKIIIYSLYY